MRLLVPRSRTPRIRVLAGGHWVIGFTILVGVVAAHAGAGQLHAFAALLLAFQAVSGFRSYRGLRRLRVSLELPERTTVGAPARAIVRVANGKRRVAVASLEAELVLADDVAVTAPPAWVDRVEGHAAADVTLPIVSTARGVARVIEVRLSSAYPAHLFRRTLRFPVDVEIPVAPASVPVSLPLAGSRDRTDAGRRRAEAGGEEFLGVRPWRPGESPRAIHQRLSARRGSPIVRENEAASRPPFTLVVDPRGLEGPRVERVLAIAASLVRAACRERRRCAFRLAGCGSAIDVRGSRAGDVALDAIARYRDTTTPPPASPTLGRVVRLGSGAESVEGPASDERAPLVRAGGPR